MKIKVSDSFSKLMNRVDCKIIISEAWLGETDQGFTPNKNDLIQIPANGIWEEENTTLKVLVIIPDEHIINSDDQRQEYGAIYFFSSTDSDEPAFILYDLDEPLSLGRNLINIEFSEVKARIKMTDTSEDTIFLETFGQNPGKNIYLTGNESSLVTKNTYYVFWRKKTTDDDTTDLPILDTTGKLITNNYTYKVYSNLRISCQGLTKTTIPHTRYGLSDDGGVVPITGIADFIEYKVFGGTITETIRGEITIEDIPGSEIVYISGHNDLGQEVSEAFNIFTANNYSSMIEYTKNEYPGSYGADGIFGLRINYYDIKEQKSIILNSVNQIKLVRRDLADDWYILEKSSRFVENTEDYGEVPVFMFPYDTSGSEYLIIRTRLLEPITDISQITVTNENEVLNNLFKVDISLSPFTSDDGTYFVDIIVQLSALTTNTDSVNWAPIINGISTLFYTKISYESYFSIIYLVQKPNIKGSLKLVDLSGNRINQIRMTDSEVSKSYYLVSDPEEDSDTDFDNRPAWKIIECPTGISFDEDSGYLSSSIRPSYSYENRLIVNYPTRSTTAQNIHLSDIKIARIKESGIPEDLMTTTNWRLLVDIAQINVGFMKYGRNISLSTVPFSLTTSGIGLYNLIINSNCQYTISSSDDGIYFRNFGDRIYSNTLNSPTYYDPRFANGEGFKHWVQVHVVKETTPTTRGPITIVATEEDRTVTKSIIIDQELVPDSIYKLHSDGEPFSNGTWNYTKKREDLPIPYEESSWVTRYSKESNETLAISTFNSNIIYSPGDIVKYSVNVNAPTWDPNVSYGGDQMVYYMGNWWISLQPLNQGNSPSFKKKTWWSCCSKYFVCVSQFTQFILGDPITTPLEVNTLSFGYTVHTAFWQEIAAIDNFNQLNTRIVSVHTAPMYESNRIYYCGDIVRFGSTPAGASAFNAFTQYHYNDIVLMGSSDPYECYKCIGYNNSNYLTNIIPGVDENWQLYWQYFDPYLGFICTKETINVTPTTLINWETVSDDFIDLPRNRRLIAVRSKERCLLYMRMGLEIGSELTPKEIKQEIDNRAGTDYIDDIKFVLEHPTLYKTGLSLRFWNPLDNTLVPEQSIIITNSGILSNEGLFFFVERDNSWVIMDDMSTISDALGDNLYDSYFKSGDKQLIKEDYYNDINYSYLIPPGNTRVIYSTQECIIGSTLENIVEQTQKQGLSYLFPYYPSYSNLPGLDCIVRDPMNRFFKVVCRISDGGKVRAAIINPDLSDHFRPGNSPVFYYKGRWNSQDTYNIGDIVYYSNLERYKVYFRCLSNNVQNINPSTDNASEWSCITWTILPSSIQTDDSAISYVMDSSHLNLNSSTGVGIRGRFNYGTTLFDATKQLPEEPKLGDIIQIGTVYYYYSIWRVIDVPTTQEEINSLITTVLPEPEDGQLFIQINDYFLCKGFSNVLIRNLTTNEYYYLDSKYVFNNIGSNKYIFIPEYSRDYTIIKYFTRKTPTETLLRSLGDDYDVRISQSTTPEYNENNQVNDHYLNHYTGVSLNLNSQSIDFIPQTQTESEGKLTLANPVNQVGPTISLPTIYNLLGLELSLSDPRFDTTKINYYLYKEPYYPSIILRKGGTEITTINLKNFYNPFDISSCTTTVEVVSPHPVVIANSLRLSYSSISTPSSLITSSFSYRMSSPRVERDGYYHYTLSLVPTANNSGVDATPIKLGDISFISRIKKNGTKPTEWVIVEDSSTGIEILKRLLRTNNIEIFDLDFNDSETTSVFRLAQLPKLEEAIPGLVYRGRSTALVSGSEIGSIGSISDSPAESTRLYVAVPYDFVKDDATDSIDKYYYTQEEIDREFGVYVKKVSIIQNSIFEFNLLGEKTKDIEFLGESRTYEFSVSGTSWNGRYIIGNKNNCTITNNSYSNRITMNVPSRILGYKPKLISDTYYVGLKDKLPVSFSVFVNSVNSSDIKVAGTAMRLLPGSSISSTLINLDSKPARGTSGLQNIKNIYYRDEYSKIGKFVRTIEKYNYIKVGYHSLRKTGYNYQQTSWSLFNRLQYQSDFQNFIQLHNLKYNDTVDPSNLYGLSGLELNTNNSNINLEQYLPTNVDDIIGFGFYKNEVPTINDPIIKIDGLNWPKLAQFGTFYTSDNITYKKFCPCQEDSLTYQNFVNLFYIGRPRWKTVDSIEEAYVDLGIATEFMWVEQQNNIVFTTPGYNTTPINSSLPIASSGNFGASFWYWKRIPKFSISAIYKVNDLVLINSGTTYSIWKCLQNNCAGIAPSENTPEWEKVVNTSFDETYISGTVSSLPNEIGNGGNLLTKYFIVGNDCYKVTNAVCTIKPIYGIIAITEPESSTSLDVIQINNPSFAYYKINRLPLGKPYRELIGSSYTVDEYSEKYARKAVMVISSGGSMSSYSYYRKQISIPLSDLYDSTTSEVYEERIFKVNYDGGYKYFQLKKNPEELLAPMNYNGSTLNTFYGYLGNSEYPGNLVLVGDVSENGYGKLFSEFPGTLFMDFNEFSYKILSFEENVNLLQKRSTKGIVTNLGENSKSDYRLYLGDFPQKNTITITVGPETTELSGMIGIFNTTSELSPTSQLTGVYPSQGIVSSPGCNINSNQRLPRLDGGQTDNFIITFDPNTSDHDLIHEIDFYTSEDGFNTRVRLKVIQRSDPGEVVVLGSSNLFFLSNGLLQNARNFGFLDFNSTLDINLNNIEILNDAGEDILDRGDEDNVVSYVNPISNSNGFVKYRAFLKLKPNTSNQPLSNFRIKIGKVIENTVTDRTILGDGLFYKYTESGWNLLGSEYIPSWLEDFVTVLPTSAEIGEVVCICNSLRGSQGYYSVALYNPRKTADFNNATGLEYRRAETREEISDLRQALGINEETNLDNIALMVSELPDIKLSKQSGLLYKIGETYYYTYADFITSGFTFGSTNIPIEIDNIVGENDQKFHLRLTRLEYDSVGNTTITELTDTAFTRANSYRLSYDTEFYSGINDDINNRIYEGDESLYFIPPEIIYSSTSLPDFVPYLKTAYNFSEQTDQASTITIKSTINIKLDYNYLGPSIPQSYREIDNLFTLYIRKN